MKYSKDKNGVPVHKGDHVSILAKVLEVGRETLRIEIKGHSETVNMTVLSKYAEKIVGEDSSELIYTEQN